MSGIRVETLARLAHAGTLLIVNALLASLSCAIFLALRWSLRHSGRTRGLVLWALSQAFVAGGFCVLILPAFQIHFVDLGLLGNLLIDLGTVFSFAAVWIYFSKPRRFGFVIIVAAAVAIVESILVLRGGEDLRVMVTVGGSLKAILTFATGLMLWQCPDPSQRVPARVAAAFHAFWGLALLIRVAWWVVHPAAEGLHDVTSSFGLLARMVLTWAITPCLLWMMSRQFDADLRRLAHEDALTGVANRRAMWVAAERSLSHAASTRSRCGVLILDVDHFKAINDRFGHPGGDQVLIAIAKVLQAAVKSPDLVARIGGEEFMVLMRDTDASAVARMAEDLRRAVETAPFAVNGITLHCTVSIGHHVAETDESWNDAVTRADRALYAAKLRGRNRAEVAEGFERFGSSCSS